MENCTKENRSHNFKDITGKKFGRISVVRISKIREYKDKNGHKKKRVVWLCVCDCGKEIEKETYHLVTGNAKSCGCLRRDLRIELNKRLRRIDAGESAFNSLIAGYKQGAEKRNLKWLLSTEFSLKTTSSDCFYCGRKPSQVRKGIWSDYIYNGIDRVDSSIGYTEDNCVPCCGPCNLMKLDYSYFEFINTVTKIFFFHVLKDSESSDMKDYRKMPSDRLKKANPANISAVKWQKKFLQMPEDKRKAAFMAMESLGLPVLKKYEKYR